MVRSPGRAVNVIAIRSCIDFISSVLERTGPINGGPAVRVPKKGWGACGVRRRVAAWQILSDRRRRIGEFSGELEATDLRLPGQLHYGGF